MVEEIGYMSQKGELDSEYAKAAFSLKKGGVFLKSWNLSLAIILFNLSTEETTE